MASQDWNASQYLKFKAERTRPARDLLAQIPLQSANRIVDLGCGPGNSTALLLSRYPTAQITGIDSSADMIRQARQTLPDVEFTVSDLRAYHPAEDENVDLFFSNAVLHWLPADERLELIKRLIQSQPAGGVFAFQVPDNLAEGTHVAMRETAVNGPWAEKLRTVQRGRDEFQSPQEIYDALKPLCAEVNVWHTHYYHSLEGHGAVVEWVRGTGLRPFIDPLNGEEREAFLEEYLGRLERVYPGSVDGRVLVRYPRLFVVARK
ncbi:S-adenosyl-L-methionine-dependent methyltransferase [Aspergillus egyptiacus]|nr:S-adenosyl-L-methionine-dependent methyltransferase [Aspergillus egyptiacus]